MGYDEMNNQVSNVYPQRAVRVICFTESEYGLFYVFPNSVFIQNSQLTFKDSMAFKKINMRNSILIFKPNSCMNSHHWQEDHELLALRYVLAQKGLQCEKKGLELHISGTGILCKDDLEKEIGNVSREHMIYAMYYLITGLFCSALTGWAAKSLGAYSWGLAGGVLALSLIACFMSLYSAHQFSKLNLDYSQVNQQLSSRVLDSQVKRQQMQGVPNLDKVQSFSFGRRLGIGG